MAALSWFVYAAFRGFGAFPARSHPGYLQHQGDFLSSIEANVVLIVASGGMPYCPLLVLVPGISAAHARALSNRADRLNGDTIIITMAGILAIAAIYLTAAIPAYGLTTAAFLVFFGVLNYVAYRDMFESRDGNLPKPVASPRVVAASGAGT